VTASAIGSSPAGGVASTSSPLDCRELATALRDQAEALRAHGECTSELNKLLAQQQAALAEARHLEAEAHRSIGAAEVREAAAVSQEKVLKEREAELEEREKQLARREDDERRRQEMLGQGTRDAQRHAEEERARADKAISELEMARKEASLVLVERDALMERAKGAEDEIRRLQLVQERHRLQQLRERANEQNVPAAVSDTPKRILSYAGLRDSQARPPVFSASAAVCAKAAEATRSLFSPAASSPRASIFSDISERPRASSLFGCKPEPEP
jgi:hypothetical protein